MVGVAVKVTGVPAHTFVAEGTMAMLTGSSGFTVSVNAFDKAGVPVAQSAFEVSWQVMISPLDGV